MYERRISFILSDSCCFWLVRRKKKYGRSCT